MLVRIEITRRSEIADPEGTTIARALADLGYKVESVRANRLLHLEMQGEDRDEVVAEAEKMCHEILANPVLEDYSIEVVG